MTTEQKIFEEYSVPRAVAAMVLPTIVSQVIHVIYNLADTWFVGLTNDPRAVSAISLCLPLYTILTSISNLFGIGGASVLARALGQETPQQARRAFSIAFWGALCTAAAYTSILFLIGRPLLLRIGGSPDNIDYAITYTMVTIVIGGVPTILSSTLAHLIRATGGARKASFGLTLGAVLNIVLDPLFMFVLLPAGNEVLGAAIATALSNTVSLGYFLCFLFRNRSDGVCSLQPSLLRGAGAMLKEIFFCGLPGFSMLALAMVSNCFLHAMIATMENGTAAVAGIGIVRKIDSLAYAVNQGITQGMLPLVAYCYTSDKTARMKAVIKLSTISTVTFSLVCTTLSWLFSAPLVSFFIKDPATISYGAEFLRRLSSAIPLYSVTFAVIAVFQAVGRKVEPFVLSVLHKGSIDILLLFFIFHVYGAYYVTWTAAIIEAFTLVVSLILLHRLLQRIKVQHPT